MSAQVLRERGFKEVLYCRHHIPSGFKNRSTVWVMDERNARLLVEFWNYVGGFTWKYSCIPLAVRKNRTVSNVREIKIKTTAKNMSRKVMGWEVRAGDEIGIGDLVYRIIGILPGPHVIGKMIAEHGHFVDSDTQYELDLRLSGWEFLKQP